MRARNCEGHGFETKANLKKLNTKLYSFLKIMYWGDPLKMYLTRYKHY